MLAPMQKSKLLAAMQAKRLLAARHTNMDKDHMSDTDITHATMMSTMTGWT